VVADGAGSAMTAVSSSLIYDSRSEVLVAPSFYVHSTKDARDAARWNTKLINLVDGGVRVGLGRPSSATLTPISQDAIFESPLQSVASSNQGLAVRGERHNQKVITAGVTQNGRLSLHVPLNTDIGIRYRKSVRASGNYVPQVDWINYEIDVPEDFGKPRAVSLYQVSGKLNVYVATDKEIIRAAIDLKASQFQGSIESLKFKTFAARAGIRFLKALNSNAVLFADEKGNVNVATAEKVSRWGNLGGYPVAVDGYKLPGRSLEIWALVHREGSERPVTIVRWDGASKAFVDAGLDIPQGQVPVAMSASGTVVQTETYRSWRHEGLYETGYLVDGETDGATTAVRRVIFVIRDGNNYVIRGVTNSSGGPKLTEPRWFYIDDLNYSLLESKLALAGFNIDQLRSALPSVDIQMAVNDRLRESYGIGRRFQPDQPQRYRGDIALITASWTARLQFTYHLRLKSSGISGMIADEGLRRSSQRLLVYELMHLREREVSESDPYAAILADLPYDDWQPEFLSRLGSEMSKLIQPMSGVYRGLNAYYQRELAPNPEKYFAQDFEYAEIRNPTARLLYLVAKHYLGRPYKFVVEDFLQYARDQKFDTSERVVALDGLMSFLEAQDPLRAVTTSEGLLQFVDGN